MFEKPTINDFLSQLYMQREQSVAEFGSELQRIKADMSRRGALKSSMTIMQMLTAMDKAVESGTAAILGELRRAATKTDLDKDQLRQLTLPRLDELFDAIVAESSWNKAKEWLRSKSIDETISRSIDSLKRKQRFLVRQFEVGFDESAEPEGVSSMTNVLNAGTIIGGVQQGTTNSDQQTNISIDANKISEAISVVERELSNADVPAGPLNEIRSELSTITSQLAKAEPNKTILREAGKSIRNVAEGVLGGLLTSPASLAISHLVTLLGS